VLGVCNIAVCLPLHALFVPGQTTSKAPEAPSEAQEATADTPELRTILRGRVFWGLAVWFTACNATASALIFQFVPLLTTWGVDMAAILTSVALIGPMQVAGRIVLMVFGTRLETRQIGTAVMVLLPAAILSLLFLPHTPLWLGLCATLYGAGNGMMTIVRGTAVTDLIGRTHYGAINGALTVPMTIARALAPVAAAAIWSATGNPALMLWALLGIILVGTGGFVLALAGASR
jgi:hypothetical protein